MPEDDFLSLSQVVQLCRARNRPISRQGLKYHLQRGSLPSRRIGHYWVVQRSDLIEWIDSHPAAQPAKVAA